MTDIVERLRLYARHFEDLHAPQNVTIGMREAADEIERLRAALREISERHVPDQPSCLDIDEADYVRRQHTELRRTARAALETPTASAAENTDDH